jgi:hypothetical protein
MTDETPRLSASIAHLLNEESPLSAWAAHRLLGNFRKPPSDSQIEATLWHAGILADESKVTVVDAENFRTKEAREQKAEALSAGRTPVLAGKWENLNLGAARIRGELERLGITFDGAVEDRIEWDEYTEDGEAVSCSGYVDHWNGTAIHDVKTSPGPVSLFQAAMLIAKSYSLLQDAAYRSAIATLHDLDQERLDFVYVFAQTAEPFSVTPVRMSGEFRQLAHLKWRRAIETWHRCLSGGVNRRFWPGPVGGITTVHPPGWMISQELELEALRDD